MAGEVPRGEKMLCYGTDPESHITKYTSIRRFAEEGQAGRGQWWEGLFEHLPPNPKLSMEHGAGDFRVGGVGKAGRSRGRDCSRIRF